MRTSYNDSAIVCNGLDSRWCYIIHIIDVVKDSQADKNVDHCICEMILQSHKKYTD